MIQPICRDAFLLARPCEAATQADLPTLRDLKDTLQAHREECVGMAANMIGVCRRIIVVAVGPAQLAMFNPEITKRSGPFAAEEGCLSLQGLRAVTRYRSIEVTWRDEDWKPHRQNFSGWTAQIIQHEVDHCAGVVI